MGYFDSIYASELPHRDIVVYMYLKHRANAEGRCWPSVRTIAKDLQNPPPREDFASFVGQDSIIMMPPEVTT